MDVGKSEDSLVDAKTAFAEEYRKKREAEMQESIRRGFARNAVKNSSKPVDTETETESRKLSTKQKVIGVLVLLVIGAICHAWSEASLKEYEKRHAQYTIDGQLMDEKYKRTHNAAGEYVPEEYNTDYRGK